MELNTYTLDGKTCWHTTINPHNNTLNRVVYFPCSADEMDMIGSIADSIAVSVASDACTPIVFAGFLSDDWNGDFSPWPAPALFKKGGDFKGNGGNTLDWMLNRFLPDIEGKTGIATPKRAILGYSLAGLFALWSIFQTDVFESCASCSGSLWFDGWVDYVKQNHIHPIERLYLSLGKKEEKSRNPKMALVGENTAVTYELMQQQLNNANIQFQLQEGGHFDDVYGRILQATLWLSQA